MSYYCRLPVTHLTGRTETQLHPRARHMVILFKTSDDSRGKVNDFRQPGIIRSRTATVNSGIIRQARDNQTMHNGQHTMPRAELRLRWRRPISRPTHLRTTSLTRASQSREFSQFNFFKPHWIRLRKIQSFTCLLQIFLQDYLYTAVTTYHPFPHSTDNTMD